MIWMNDFEKVNLSSCIKHFENNSWLSNFSSDACICDSRDVSFVLFHFSDFVGRSKCFINILQLPSPVFSCKSDTSYMSA